MDIFDMMRKTETRLDTLGISTTLKNKLSGVYDSLEDIEDMTILRIQRNISRRLQPNEKAVLEKIISDFRDNEYVIAKTVDFSKCEERMCDCLKEYIKEQNWGFVIDGATCSTSTDLVRVMVNNMSILGGRAHVRAFLKWNNFSDAEIAYAMTRFANSYRID